MFSFSKIIKYGSDIKIQMNHHTDYKVWIWYQNSNEPPYFIIFETKTSFGKIHIITILYHHHTWCFSNHQKYHKTKKISCYWCHNKHRSIYDIYIPVGFIFNLFVAQKWSFFAVFYRFLQIMDNDGYQRKHDKR